MIHHRPCFLSSILESSQAQIALVMDEVQKWWKLYSFASLWEITLNFLLLELMNIINMELSLCTNSMKYSYFPDQLSHRFIFLHQVSALPLSASSPFPWQHRNHGNQQQKQRCVLIPYSVKSQQRPWKIPFPFTFRFLPPVSLGVLPFAFLWKTYFNLTFGIYNYSNGDILTPNLLHILSTNLKIAEFLSPIKIKVSVMSLTSHLICTTDWIFRIWQEGRVNTPQARSHHTWDTAIPCFRDREVSQEFCGQLFLILEYSQSWLN